MNEQKKKYKVVIFGEPYTLVSDEAEQHVVEAAAGVDKLMQEFAKQAGINDAKKLAVFVALQFSSELKRLASAMEARDQEQARLSGVLDRELAGLK